jgi:phosphatidylglycerophosphate synthase
MSSCAPGECFFTLPILDPIPDSSALGANIRMNVSFKNAIRQQQSILAPLEHRALLWCAKRMPPWIGPDHLTVLGFAGMISAGIAYYLTRYDSRALLLVVVCLGINWFGDSLDGTLARYREKQRPRYGFYVDHMVDVFGALCLIGGLGLSEYMTGTVAMALMIAYFILSIEIYLATYTVGVFRLSFGWWGPTELRILLAIGNLVLLVKPRVTIAGGSYLLCDVGAVVTAAGMGIVTIVSTIRNTARLYDEERLP